jgi:hypothetical protein
MRPVHPTAFVQCVVCPLNATSASDAFCGSHLISLFIRGISGSVCLHSMPLVHCCLLTDHLFQPGTPAVDAICNQLPLVSVASSPLVRGISGCVTYSVLFDTLPVLVQHSCSRCLAALNCLWCWLPWSLTIQMFLWGSPSPIHLLPNTPATLLAGTSSHSSRPSGNASLLFGSWDSSNRSVDSGTSAIDAICNRCLCVSTPRRLCCRLNRSPVLSSHSAAISLDRSLWESTCLARHSCDRSDSVDACVGRLFHAFFAFLTCLWLCRHAELVFICRQWPVLASHSAAISSTP